MMIKYQQIINDNNSNNRFYAELTIFFKDLLDLAPRRLMRPWHAASASDRALLRNQRH